jgi:hypothetical protein
MLLGLVALLAVFASAVLVKPPGGAPTPSNEFRFIGFTDDAFNGLPDTIDGDEGVLAMHALCQDDFGPDARMCIQMSTPLSQAILSSQ